ncbi:glycine/D-amino acid oxidase-like deaminating enzyme [Georgenia soli]|uniref:Glycine/D-amino acid oxidase-like deaminating enzyme n=1 Tax=Georgenia soli TaxID=638953 RepID=A0A2A9EK72_9MICO|nr:FAD-dependent oxidoreductase [Georgenia soli]PFG39298.1 glycine/D-amino acid oxidase-like deaminating enzyme [Georgenia soli]
MRCIVVGAGAWGLPAAAELVGRGHDVVLLDRYGVANALSSSSGPTRIWRLTHPDRVRVRLARRGVEAMERLASRSGTEVFLRRGLLWRDDASIPAVVEALGAEGVAHELVEPDDVGRYFPGLRPDGRRAVWQADAGPVLAAGSMRAQAGLLEAAGGTVVTGAEVREVRTTPHGPEVVCVDGTTYAGDVVVLAPGPGAQPLLATLGLDLPLRPRLEQVVHVGDPADPHAADGMPCLFDGPRHARDDVAGADGASGEGADAVSGAGADEPGMYAMATPGVGYKLGLDRSLRDLVPGDEDRTPEETLTELIVERVRRDLGALTPRALDAQVCSWTMSPDGRFVIDRLPGGVVLACGDSGEGFKFSALMGIVLADLAEGRTPDDDVASFSLQRFAGGIEVREHVLGL